MGYTANSTSLGNNYLKGEGLNRTQTRNYQAHHMIPLELVRTMDADNQCFYDQDWNCLMLPNSDDAIIHYGNHPDYTEYVKRLIGEYIRNHTDVTYTFYGAAKAVASAVRAWYNDVIPSLRNNQVYEININYINNLEACIGVSVRNYIR